MIEVRPGYAVDKAGNVYCCRPINGKGSARSPWRAVKPLLCSDGRYFQVGIDGVKLLVHRLVAVAYLGACPDGMEVSHINGDSHDNRACNLTYATHAKNEAMKRVHGTAPRGERNGSSVLTNKQVMDIRRRVSVGRRGVQSEIARELGVSVSTVSMIANGLRWD